MFLFYISSNRSHAFGTARHLLCTIRDLFMASASGLSADPFEVISLVRDIIRGLKSNENYLWKFLDLFSELRGLGIALIYVKNQHAHAREDNHRHQLRSAAEKCRDTLFTHLLALDTCGARTFRYDARSQTQWMVFVQGIEWLQCTEDQINSFQIQIASQTRQLETCLAFVHESVEIRAVWRCGLTFSISQVPRGSSLQHSAKMIHEYIQEVSALCMESGPMLPDITTGMISSKQLKLHVQNSRHSKSC